LLFLKERKSDRSFEKSEKRAITHSLFKQRAPKRAIAHSLFLKEQMSKRLLNCSFEKSGNER